MTEHTQEIFRWTMSVLLAIVVFGGIIALIITDRKIDKEIKEQKNKKAS